MTLKQQNFCDTVPLIFSLITFTVFLNALELIELDLM